MIYLILIRLFNIHKTSTKIRKPIQFIAIRSCNYFAVHHKSKKRGLFVLIFGCKLKTSQMNKTEICVPIRNEEELQQAKDMLEKNGEVIDESIFYISDSGDNFLQYSDVDFDWFLSRKGNLTEIPLSELESVLKGESVIRDVADKYQELFNHMSNEHNLTLTISEMNEIITVAIETQNKLKND